MLVDSATEWTASDLRAERARQQVPIYILAGRLRVHPFHLGQLLNERRVLMPRMAGKIARALGLPSRPGDAAS